MLYHFALWNLTIGHQAKTPCVWVSSTRETVIHQPAVVPASQHHGVSPHGSVLHHTGACSLGPPPTVVFTHGTINIVDLFWSILVGTGMLNILHSLNIWLCHAFSKVDRFIYRTKEWQRWSYRVSQMPLSVYFCIKLTLNFSPMYYMIIYYSLYIWLY